jgi:bacterial/archaeal transporter family protein
MQAWQQAALGAACLIALHYILLRASSGRVGDSLGALVLEGTAAIGILVAYLFGPRGDLVSTTGLGLGFAAVSGLCISGASILLFFALRRGGPVAATGTIVLGGGVAISALLAPMLFREPFTVRRAVGVALGIAAMVVLSTERAAPPDVSTSEAR